MTPELQSLGQIFVNAWLVIVPPILVGCYIALLRAVRRSPKVRKVSMAWAIINLLRGIGHD